MKTKIIYISGNETFEMAQIRAAFDEVRATLGLDNDTVLFGVPVDSDDALAETADIDTNETVVQAIIETSETNAEPEAISESDATETPEISETEKADIPEIITETIPEESTTVVPILSVLGGQDTDTAPESEPEIEPEIPEIESEFDIQEPVTEPVVGTVIETPGDKDTDIVPEKISLDDVADPEEPVSTSEKTLEQLLESMTPLREDTVAEENTVQIDTPAEATLDTDDTDATLAQLASEFAQNEDKIASSTKNETGGKIGKLKNILPFKKAKRDDNSLMGDLFGWAGIAANDEDFSIPGFFTQNAKKQGA